MSNGFAIVLHNYFDFLHQLLAFCIRCTYFEHYTTAVNIHNDTHNWQDYNQIISTIEMRKNRNGENRRRTEKFRHTYNAFCIYNIHILYGLDSHFTHFWPSKNTDNVISWSYAIIFKSHNCMQWGRVYLKREDARPR